MFPTHSVTLICLRQKQYVRQEQNTTTNKWIEVQHKMKLWSCGTRDGKQTVDPITSIKPVLCPNPIQWFESYPENQWMHHHTLPLNMTSMFTLCCGHLPWSHAFVPDSIPRHRLFVPQPATLATTLSAKQTCEWHKCFTELSFPAQDVQHQSASVAPAVQTCFKITARCHGWSRQWEPMTNQSLDKGATEGRETKYRGRKRPINYSY